MHFQGGSCIGTAAEKEFLEAVCLLQPPLKMHFQGGSFNGTAPFSGAEILTEPPLEIHFQGRLKARR